mgnify:CR=1 FL=1
MGTDYAGLIGAFGGVLVVPERRVPTAFREQPLVMLGISLAIVAVALLFAVGAVSGTVLSFEMGLLWPGLMSRFGDVIGLPFAMEGIAFFLEAVFLGIYLYGWDRLPPRVHLATLVPIMVSGLVGTFCILAVNAWMNAPSGFRIVDGERGAGGVGAVVVLVVVRDDDRVFLVAHREQAADVRLDLVEVPAALERRAVDRAAPQDRRRRPGAPLVAGYRAEDHRAEPHPAGTDLSRGSAVPRCR